IAAACSGFLYTLETASNFIKSGGYRNVLAIGAETLSRITDYKDRGSCILFGDGAGAVVMQRGNDPKRGLIYRSLHAAGQGGTRRCWPTASSTCRSRDARSTSSPSSASES